MQSQRELIRLSAGETFRLLRWSQSVSTVELVQDHGRTTVLTGRGDHWHYHPAMELTLVQKGQGTRLIADDIDLFDDGDLVLIGPNVPHYWQMRGRSSGLSIQWDFHPEHGIWKFAESAEIRSLIESARRGLHLTGSTAGTIRHLLEAMPSQSGVARLSDFLQILATVINAPKGDVQALSSRPFSMIDSPETQEIISRAVSYILAHYREEVHLNELLKLTGMSRATFARQFLLHSGKSFSTFRNQVRLQAVCHALRETSEPVGTIALNHGFNQLSFFNRLFRREFGMNPSEYRQKLQNPAES